MGIGPLMLDLNGLCLEREETELLEHPATGGVILFSRNYETTAQLQALISQIRAVRPEAIIAVDQEGGRVQRFKSGVTRLPPLRELGQQYDSAPDKALEMASDWGWLMAAEMTSLGIDISFAPVLDIDYGRSEVIGNRAFASQPESLVALAQAYISGMASAGMAATGKHFPGHGWVAADSHVDIPVDDRPLSDIETSDIIPFKHLVSQLAGIMPAHVIYSQVDSLPAGFSTYWLQDQLRTRLGFNGVIFSDDLTMEGAKVAGGFVERAQAAFTAGCDMVLVCNHRQGAIEVLNWLGSNPVSVKKERFAALQAKPKWNWQQLQLEQKWQRLQQTLVNQ